MSWLTAEQLKSKFNFKLDDQTEDEPIEFAQESAAADLEDWLERDDYALAESENEPDALADKKKVRRIVAAHAYLTLYYIFLNNTQIRASGTVGNEKGPDDATAIQFLKPSELKQLRSEYLMQAKNLIAKFAVVNFSETVETDNPASDYAVCNPLPKDWHCRFPDDFSR